MVSQTDFYFFIVALTTRYTVHIDHKLKDEKDHKEISTNNSGSTSKGQNENILNTMHLFYNLDEAVM